MSLRILFMGTPDFAVPALSEIVGAGYDVVAVYTQPPRPAGRGMSLRASAVHQFAEQAGLDVYIPKTLRSAAVQRELIALEPDIIVVAAYGLILPKAILDAPPYGCLNIHASLLPRWRGASPIQRAIMAGDSETGVMIMKMEQGLDTGPIAFGEKVPIGPDITGGELHDQLSTLGASMISQALIMTEQGTLDFRPQVNYGVTYAHKLSKQETQIDWRQNAAGVHDQIRAFSPYPGAWFEALLGGKAERIKILRSVVVPGEGEPGQLLDANLTVACATHAIRLTKVQRAGKKPMSGIDLLRGFPLGKGTHFG